MNSQSPSFPAKPQPKRPPTPFQPHDNVIETLRDVGSGIATSIKDDVFKKTSSNALNSIFGAPPSGGDYQKNPFERHNGGFQREAPIAQRRPDVLNPMRISQEQARVKQQIESIRAELIGLAKELGQLHQEIEKAITEVPVDPGTYHLNFFERLKGVIILLRKSVHDSRSWLSLSSGKKKQKGYWNSYKKHGTKFGLSADRTPATQTG